ncbi:pectate lyase [Roseimicrobium sp. ORNL1]|uniref:pectate lyase family protein n=1 Tax=Roseimicrobium sp. ORNL1 TaxID=2711231 RepID=UPI0013E1758C|nr:pectate lyase [Roseimicrobium sp. ORNL1]QIF03655.1 pectate lyase [Roseimicrobium sp. ORNL1]
MKPLLLFLLLGFSATVALFPLHAKESIPVTRLPAFPGAEGAGKWSKGGRGGKVIAVTNLNDSGPGSLRAAVDMREPRTVIFRVSGTIELQKPIRIAHPFITIAGQTAPGDGICLKGQELQIGATHDVIVRYLRCRLGDKTSKASERDAISIWDARDVIIDHCSATWSTDECLSVTNDSDRVTVQHCLIAEALTEHSYGSIIGSHRGAISYLYNLYACNRARNPRPGGYQTTPGHADDPGPQIDFRHNVIFNWDSGPGYTGAGYADQPERIAMNYVGNYLKPGLDTAATYRDRAFVIYKGATAELYLDGNVSGDGTVSRPATPQSDLLIPSPGCTLIHRETPLPLEPLTEKENLKAIDAYKRALEIVGASKPARDAADTRIVNGVRDGTGRRKMTIPDDAWPTLNNQDALPDQDNDGLPDAWEQSQGLNSNDPSDANKPSTPNGYTHLEVWMNAL